MTKSGLCRLCALLLAVLVLALVLGACKTGLFGGNTQALKAYDKGNLDEASKLYLESALNDDPEAQYHAGYMYSAGEGVQKNPELAAGWMNKAAQAGVPEAQTTLGIWKINGYGGQSDPAGGAAMIQKAAQQEDPAAMYLMGHAYAEGTGVNKDPAQALNWFRKAGTGGFPVPSNLTNQQGVNQLAAKAPAQRPGQALMAAGAGKQAQPVQQQVRQRQVQVQRAQPRALAAAPAARAAAPAAGFFAGQQVQPQAVGALIDMRIGQLKAKAPTMLEPGAPPAEEAFYGSVVDFLGLNNLSVKTLETMRNDPQGLANLAAALNPRLDELMRKANLAQPAAPAAQAVAPGAAKGDPSDILQVQNLNKRIAVLNDKINLWNNHRSMLQSDINRGVVREADKYPIPSMVNPDLAANQTNLRTLGSWVDKARSDIRSLTAQRDKIQARIDGVQPGGAGGMLAGGGGQGAGNNDVVRINQQNAKLVAGMPKVSARDKRDFKRDDNPYKPAVAYCQSQIDSRYQQLSRIQSLQDAMWVPTVIRQINHWKSRKSNSNRSAQRWTRDKKASERGGGEGGDGGGGGGHH